jgi:RNA polymerase sigma factor (TIGR02999 family)
LPAEIAGSRSGIIDVMTDVTQILSQIENGNPAAAEQLLPLVYDELRRLAAARLANEKPGQTLQATALVHEAYIRLVGVEKGRHWENRGHFFASAAEAMRRILLNRARDKNRLKRRHHPAEIDVDQIQLALDSDDDQMIALDEALVKLSADDELCGQIVKLRFFAGLTLRETAEALGLSQRTAERQWAYARAWLYHELCREERSPGQ